MTGDSRRFIRSNREILREMPRRSWRAKTDLGRECSVSGEPRGGHRGTSKARRRLFAGSANLSDPIPTTRRKKTFDKRPDVLTKGPSRPGSACRANPDARRCPLPPERRMCLKVSWTLEEINTLHPIGDSLCLMIWIRGKCLFLKLRR